MTFPERPITAESYLVPLKHYLSNGIPATYTLEQVHEYEKAEKGETVESGEEESSNTTPLHILARSIPGALPAEEVAVVLEMINVLFEYGAGWNFIDYENKTVGDLFVENGYGVESTLYQRIVDAGVSAELLLRKINDNVEFLDDEGPEGNSDPGLPASDKDATAGNQEVYLQTELEYTDTALVTKENKDGVMMDWESGIMKLAAQTVTSSLDDNRGTDCVNILNIGFGMGIIDSYIQEIMSTQHPEVKFKHYICEAHPDVLAKMAADGWYQNPSVVVLEGRWQEQLAQLLDEGTTFLDGIYYDTFSEYYKDILELYDVLCGLIKPQGVFSFFNGLGADRQLCYEVYRKIVSIDVANYGMQCEYTTVNIGGSTEITTNEPDWQDVKRSYYNCSYYHHPRISFV